MTDVSQENTPSLEHLVEEGARRRRAIRALTADEFIERHGSGTLRKNRSIGMAWREQYLSERVAYEFGWEFALTPRTRLTYGPAQSEENCAGITEAGWHIERYKTLSVFPEDEYTAAYIQIEQPHGSREEGIGIVVEKTSAPFIPQGHVAYAIITPYNTTQHRYEAARNPF